MNKSRDWDSLKQWEKGKLKEKLDYPPLYINGKKWKFNEDAWLNELNLTWRRVIENDVELKNEFYKFEWAPYDIAIKITSKLLDVSYQKIKDILYRKQKQK